ncbi:MAG: apolipoprotein N-acyltransferase [Planctomycetaceae bacterium]|nr:apolipoprotein N-acyltransferase [Planctomycetaceae bacterium]
MSKPSDATDVQESNAGLRPEIEQIIASGQRRVSKERSGSALTVLMLCSASAVLLWSCFTPLDFSPIAWIALVPLIQVVRLNSIPRWSWMILFITGFIWSAVTLQWMRLGDPAMIIALLALSFYLAFYFPAFVWISRRIHSRGFPLLIAVPVVWTSLEYVRAYLLTGFSWYYLGHSQYQWSAFIQIADITGAYGVSFVVALANTAVAIQIPYNLLKSWNLDSGASAIEEHQVPRQFVDRPRTAGLIAVSVVTLCCGYGSVRSVDPASFRAGPVVALIQGNFSPEVKHDPEEWVTRYQIHDQLTRRCVDLRPDLIVWPETMWPWPDRTVEGDVTDEQLLEQLPPPMRESGDFTPEMISRIWRSDDVRKSLHDHAAAVGAALMMGIESHVVSASDLKAFNSAAFVRPDLGYMGRYDKIHRVIFGEYIPLKSIFPWLTNLTPFGPYFGIAAGESPMIFETAGFRLAPLICFEDTVPHLVRRIAGKQDESGQACDVLVNLTNDAWFRGSSELDQHLITAVFRCVETRKPLVRAVNGGISAFIDGNGTIREPDQILVAEESTMSLTPAFRTVSGMRDPETGRWRRQMSAIVFGQVPLDDRRSLYLQIGDVFAASCLVAMLVGCFKRVHVSAA